MIPVFVPFNVTFWWTVEKGDEIVEIKRNLKVTLDRW